MRAVENAVGRAGAAPTVKEGGLAPKTGAHEPYCNQGRHYIPTTMACQMLWGTLVIEAESNTLVLQKYDKYAKKYRRWRVTVVKVEEVVE
jgi:hypothetical protein